MGVEGQGGLAFDALQGAVIITTRNPIQSDLDPTDVRPGVSGEPGGGWRRVWAMPHMAVGTRQESKDGVQESGFESGHYDALRAPPHGDTAHGYRCIASRVHLHARVT